MPETLLQVRIRIERALDFQGAITGRQDGVKVRFDRRRNTGCFKPFGMIKWILSDGIPEPGSTEKGRDAIGVLTLKETYQIGRHSEVRAGAAVRSGYPGHAR